MGSIICLSGDANFPEAVACVDRLSVRTSWKRQRLRIDQLAHPRASDAKGNCGSRAPDQPADRTMALALPRFGSQRPDQAILQRWFRPGGGEEPVQALIEPAGLAQLGSAGLAFGSVRLDALSLRRIQPPRHIGGQVLTHPGMLRHNSRSQGI
jgi:hypothetical protein